MMKISKREQDQIKAAIAIGKEIGFGNLISHLGSAWTEMLIEEGIPESYAMKCAPERSYPIQMHRDVVNNGEWDETGEKYRKSE